MHLAVILMSLKNLVELLLGLGVPILTLTMHKVQAILGFKMHINLLHFLMGLCWVALLQIMRMG